MECPCRQAQNETPPGAAGMPRRKMLGWLVGIINLGVVSSIIGPTLGFIGSPLKQRKAKGVWVPVLDVAELPDGETRAVNYRLDVEDGYMTSARTYSAYVYRKGETIVGFDTTCPHLGCHVEFKPRKQRYVCPCHGGVFDADGNHVSGPPPRGLTKIATKVEEGRIWLYKV